MFFKCDPCLSEKPSRKLLLSSLFTLNLTNLNGYAKSYIPPPLLATSYTQCMLQSTWEDNMLTLFDLARPCSTLLDLCSTSARPCSTCARPCSTSPRPLFCHFQAVFENLWCLISPGVVQLVLMQYFPSLCNAVSKNGSKSTHYRLRSLNWRPARFEACRWQQNGLTHFPLSSSRFPMDPSTTLVLRTRISSPNP